MWLSRKKYDMLVASIEKLEASLKERTSIPVFEGNPYTMYNRSVSISHTELLHGICQRLGLRLEYVAGGPSRVRVVSDK